MNDHISRKAALAAIESYKIEHCPEYMQNWASKIKRAILDDIVDDVKALPEVEAEPKWIPVTERLPEVVDSYIVVVKCKYDWDKEYEIGVDVATYDPYSDNPYIDGCWNTYNDWNEGQQYLHVTHWMPLPEPPKE